VRSRRLFDAVLGGLLVFLLALVSDPGPGTARGALERAPGRSSLVRVELHLVPDARERAHALLMTLGGPVYCRQLLGLAQYLDASLLCPDYARNGERAGSSRAARVEDWGDPRYLDEVAQLPARLRAGGIKFSETILVGASYAGYANTELIATHPQLRPSALILVDTFFDLADRYQALPPSHETRTEINRVLGGTLAERPKEYAARSPSHHLRGLAQAIRHGMKLVVVWSVSNDERREFDGATCSRAASAQWLGQLATLLGRPLVGYVTQLKHADALRYWGTDLLTLAGVARGRQGLPARAVTFRSGGPLPAGSYCG
jgi:pimeloyl-ACP methyl ester carboxylesterase